MNKTFFTLIYGDKIKAAPGKKIIPASELSVLQESYQILEHTKEDADKYRLEVTEECEKIKEMAYQEGYEEGYKQWSEQLAHLENRFQDHQKAIQQMIIPVALKAAKKIVGREIELSEDSIVDIIASNLKGITQHKKITIFVNKKELDILEQNKQKLRDLFEHAESFSIRPRDDIAPGGCVIETEVGIVNAQMEHRWKVLEKAFEALLKSTPEKGS